MFDAGFQEVFLVFVIGLLVLGPKRLPRAAHAAGLWLGRARNAMSRLQRELRREMFIEETREAVERARAAVTGREPDKPDKPDKPDQPDEPAQPAESVQATEADADPGSPADDEKSEAAGAADDATVTGKNAGSAEKDR